MSLDIIDNVVHWRGYIVAVIAEDGTPASIVAEFVDGLDNGTLRENEAIIEANDELLRRAAKSAKGGWVRLKELEQHAKEIQEEKA